MKLMEYPAAIAKARRELLSAQQHIRALREALAQLTAEIDRQVAFDETLTNDTKRKAKRAELMELPSYKAMLGDLQIAEDQCAEVEINLTLLRDTFSVLKLEERRQIAELETGAIAA